MPEKVKLTQIEKLETALAVERHNHAQTALLVAQQQAAKQSAAAQEAVSALAAKYGEGGKFKVESFDAEAGELTRSPIFPAEQGDATKGAS